MRAIAFAAALEEISLERAHYRAVLRELHADALARGGFSAAAWSAYGEMLDRYLACHRELRRLAAHQHAANNVVQLDPRASSHVAPVRRLGIAA